jgi:hypothetical protein
MNLRTFTIAMLISAMPVTVLGDGKEISLAKEDFISATQVTQDGETIVSAKLSKSGKAKLRKINKLSADQTISADIGGVQSDFKVRAPLQGEGIQFGPYPESDAQKVIQAINQQ